MSAAAHTPAGWSIHRDGDIWVVGHPDPTRLIMFRKSKEQAELARDQANERDAIERVRDAAPDMLAALQAFNAAHEEEDSTAYSDKINHANGLMVTAIAKATGAQP